MDDLYKIILTGLFSLLASSSFGLYIQKRSDKRNALECRNDTQAEMLRGLGHDRIIRLGLEYIQRGFVTSSEYENLKDYLYLPYKKLGGNGSADRVMVEVDKLDIKE